MKPTDKRGLSAFQLVKLRGWVIDSIEGGASKAKTARDLSVSRRTVYKWWGIYTRAKEAEQRRNRKEEQDGTIDLHRDGRASAAGKERLSILGKRGPRKGVPRILSRCQYKQLLNILVKRVPQEFGLPYYAWTLRIVRLLIKQLYGLDVAPSYVSRWLTMMKIRIPAKQEYYSRMTRKSSVGTNRLPFAVDAAQSNSVLYFLQQRRFHISYLSHPTMPGSYRKSRSSIETDVSHILYAATPRGHIVFVPLRCRDDDNCSKKREIEELLYRLKQKAHRKLVVVVEHTHFHILRKFDLKGIEIVCAH